MTLSSDWEVIGQSGPTTDGRVIQPEWLVDAAETYDTSKKTALIWPFHIDPKPWWLSNLGQVVALKAEKGADGLTRLFAKLKPTPDYLAQRQAGQKTFTSMELMPNFAKSGRFYLSGLVATDDPASLGTTAVQFSKHGDSTLFYSSFVESQKHVFTESAEPDLLERIKSLFFKNQSEDAEMAVTKEELTQMFAAQTTAIVTGITEAMKGFSKGAESDKKDNTPPAADADTLTFSKAQELLKAAIENGGELPPDPNAPVTQEQFSKMLKDALADKASAGGKSDEADKGGAQQYSAEQQEEMKAKIAKQEAELAELKKQFTAATQEQPGTNGGEHFGANDKDMSKYL